MGKIGKFRRTKIGRSRIEVGRFTYGHDLIEVKQWREGASLTIGSFCSIAEGVEVLLGGNHRVDWATTYPFGHIFVDELGGAEITGHPTTNGDVVIGNDVWIGRKASIMSGITIGDGAVIAANSTVTKDVGAYEIWGGNPAKKIKDRFSQDITQALLDLQWWNLDQEVIKKIAPLLSTTVTMSSLKDIKAVIQS